MPSRTRIARLLVLTVLGFGLAGALASAPAATAAAYTVTKTTDTNDGVCDADCSLREAVAAANAAPNPDTITLPPGIYLITGIEISLTSPITLTGALSTTTIIASRGWNAGTLYVPAGGLAVIANVTLMGGDNTFGGGLSNAGTLTLVDSIVRHNTGVVAGGIVNGGHLTIRNSRIQENAAGLYSYSCDTPSLLCGTRGGGISNRGFLTITHSLIAGNTAGIGAGLLNEASGVAWVEASTFQGNVAHGAWGGAGVLNLGVLTVTESLFFDNRAIDYGAGLKALTGTVTIQNTSFSHNSAPAGGGGLYIASGARVTVLNSAFIDNTGNAIHNYGVLTMTNATLAGTRPGENVASASGLFNDWGGVATLNNVTVSDNWGYGIYRDLSPALSTLSLANTLVYGNRAGACTGASPLISLDYNLFQALNPECVITGTTTHNVMGLDPRLGWPQANGGATVSQPLLAGSPALDAGSPAAPGSGGAACAAADQRGAPRPAGVACDIGASEGVFNAPAHLAFTLSDAADPVALGQAVRHTIVITNTGPGLTAGLRLTDTLPPEAALGPVTTSLGACQTAAGQLVCGPVSLPAGAAWTVTVALTPTQAGQLLNTATIGEEAPPAAAVNTTRQEATRVDLFLSQGGEALPSVVDGGARVAWGDYDADGDLDLAYTGYGSDGVKIAARIFNNDGAGNLQAVAMLAAVSEGAVAWADYDNDGDLDLLLTGNANPDPVASPQPVTHLYRNMPAGFFEVGLGLPGVRRGEGAWGDYDNDGDLDLLLTGDGAAGRLTRLYRNEDGSAFVDVNAGLLNLGQSAAAWGDYDNDGDLDLVLMGFDGLGSPTRLYQNQAGVFAATLVRLIPVQRGDVTWGDYDADGDLDLAVLGCSTGCIPQMFINRNDGAGAFPEAYFLVTAQDAVLDWGDYDNDGDLDLLLASGVGPAVVLRNDGQDLFVDTGVQLQASSAAWGDADGDGRLDIAAPAHRYSPNRPRGLFINHLPVRNTPPAAPTGLTAVVSGTMALLGWEAAGDRETPAAGLNYEVRVGTTPGSPDVLSPNGGGRLGLTRPLTGLAPGTTYYWSVRAVDGAGARSPFAAEVSFTTPGTRPSPTLSATPTASATPGEPATATRTPTVTQTPQLTGTVTASATPGGPATATGTQTPRLTGTVTATATPGGPATATPTPTQPLAGTATASVGTPSATGLPVTGAAYQVFLPVLFTEP